ncbi:MAG: hypothetical protein ACK55I_03600, partial [bacterium]
SVVVEAAELHEQAGEDGRAAEEQGQTDALPAGGQGDAGAQHGRGREEEGERCDEFHVPSG